MPRGSGALAHLAFIVRKMTSSVVMMVVVVMVGIAVAVRGDILLLLWWTTSVSLQTKRGGVPFHVTNVRRAAGAVVVPRDEGAANGKRRGAG